ncbi:alpha/beta hydrolase [Nocardia rhamnosiphila]|uniref:alpha/beta hydrolase n=1 Tax=Nocardia rhamnosiphila TaxID=426716 RepID=UPI00056236C7|nr:alpha/beta hydrolase [Nocardia rhamnosiphila]
MATAQTIEPVSIKALNWGIAADLHLPDGFDPSSTYPVVITVHPIGSCKEQTSGSVYGAALAEQGPATPGSRSVPRTR